MLPSPCYAISDVHLGAAPPAAERTFRDFLHHLRGRAGSLLINGDLFDFWFEWRTVIPRAGYRVLAAVAELSENGVPVLWIAGNHDCWGAVTLREAGVMYDDRPWTGELAGWRSLVEHGDGARGREDRRYRLLRRVLRHPASMTAFRLLHPDLGTRVASHSSNASRRQQAARDAGRGLRRVALERLERDRSLELVIFGHSHVPALEQTPAGGVYANAGAWLSRPTFLRVDERRIALCEWSDSAQCRVLDAVHRRGSEESPGES